MSDDVYLKLARHLDKLPGGYPATEDGLELRILRRLFTPEQAEIALCLNLIAETVPVVARRVGFPQAVTKRLLEEMADNGLVYDIYKEGRPTKYMITQFVVGIWEFQVNRLDLELIRDVDEYIERALFDAEAWRKTPQLRTIPIGESISNPAEVMPYEHVQTIVDSHTRFAVADCICRKEKGMEGEDCGKPLEACIIMGQGADYYIRHGMGRPVEKAEVMQILRLANEAGLVLQPSNAKDVGNICCCCGDCCGVLRTINQHPHPSSLVSSAFQALVNADRCTACGICIDRCQMHAVEVEDYAVILYDRCIGCGLCVTTCPTGAIQLQRKTKDEQAYVPKNTVEKMLRMGRDRGVLKTPDLIGMVVRSGIDRLGSSKSD